MADWQRCFSEIPQLAWVSRRQEGLFSLEGNDQPGQQSRWATKLTNFCEDLANIGTCFRACLEEEQTTFLSICFCLLVRDLAIIFGLGRIARDACSWCRWCVDPVLLFPLRILIAILVL